MEYILPKDLIMKFDKVITKGRKWILLLLCDFTLKICECILYGII